jgi:hypothetical protein
MAHLKLSWRKTISFLTLVTIAAACPALALSVSVSQDGLSTRGQSRAAQADTAAAVAPHAAEDISGMYSFLKEGEFLQISLETTSVTGYISRMGDSDSDNGVFLDQFFAKADVQGHEVSFTTKPLHGIWYDFKGKFDRGPAKTKSLDGYYILRGTLKELTYAPDKTVTTTRSREVEFKLLAQPDDSDEAAPAKSKKPK